MDFIAHIRESDKQIQTVKEHLLGAKQLAESFGEKIGVKHIAGLAGLLHDCGKYSNEFRNYILEAISNPSSPPKRGSVDHSTAGGKLLFELFHTEKIQKYTGILAEIVGNAVISHHSYLQDYLTHDLESDYLKRVRDKELLEYEMTKHIFFEEVMNESEFYNYVDKAASELEQFLAKERQENYEKQLMFLTKFIFSALIDADRTDTRLFEEKKSGDSVHLQEELFEIYYKRLMKKINSFKEKKDANSEINRLRAEMSKQCDIFAEQPPGIYTLSIPTGGGKTLASLRYALKHAKIFNKKRIIYVLPYTTIIEQNAEEVRKILNDEKNILEHHSNVVEDEQNNDENQDSIINTNQKLKLAKDNWDSPIIFTTMVQFLNVFYAKGTRNIRRLHNLSESIIIFDEVQKVPIHCVSLFNQALNFLKKFGKCSVVLCTATQPALDFVEHKLEINSDAEIIKDLNHVIEAFKRVEIIDKATNEFFNNEKLADFIVNKIETVQSILVILNTKSVVKNLYNILKERKIEIPIFHLSTSMCAAHRSNILNEVKKLLKAEKKVICISTQLIEAGVDISFECVIRSLAGLDSIAQAAGRCNRHGEKEIQNVYVIDHEEENLNYLNEIKVGKKVAKRIFIDIKNDKKNYGGNILSNQAMDKYFKEFYSEFKSDLNYFIPKLKKNIVDLLTLSKSQNNYYKSYCVNKGKALPLFLVNSYKTAAEYFNVIEDLTVPVIVPYGKGKDLIIDLGSDRTVEDLSQLLRKTQQFTINLYRYEKDQLDKNGGLVSYMNGKILFLKESAYNEEFGLDVKNDSYFLPSIY